jgi:vitamin B12 transporter
MLDGRPLNDPALGQADISLLNPHNISKIEIFRGPVSAYYGANAMSGAVNVVTTPAGGIDGKNEAGFSAGSFGMKNRWFNINTSGDDVIKGISLSGNTLISDGFRNNSDCDLVNMSAAITCEPGGAGEISLNLGRNERDIGVPGSNSTPVTQFDNYKERQASSPNARMEDENNYAVLRHKIASGRNSVETSLSYDFLKRDYTDPDAFVVTVSMPRNAEIKSEFATDSGFALGLSHRAESFRREDLSLVSIDKKRGNSAVFSSKQFKPGKWVLSLSARYDYNSVYKGYFSPCFSAVHAFSDSLKFSAGAGTAFRAPTFEDLYSPLITWPASMWGAAGETHGNIGVKPEKSAECNTGFELKLGSSTAVRTVVFYKAVKDLIEWQNVSATLSYDNWQPINTGRAFSAGGECEITSKLFSVFLLRGNYSYLTSKDRSGGDWRTLQYTPRHRGNLTLAFTGLKNVSVYSRISYVHRQLWSDFIDHEIPGRTLADAGISFDAGKPGPELFFSVKNVFDRRYVVRENYPMPGRELSGGLLMRF